MANNPFDPPIVQVKKTLDRGGISTVNKGFGSLKSGQGRTRPAPPSESAPGIENLSDMNDVDVATLVDGQILAWDATVGLWVATTNEAVVPGLPKDRRWTVGPMEVSIDEFNDNVIDPAWVIAAHASIPALPSLARPRYVEAADVLSVKYGPETGVGSGTADGATTRHHGLVRLLSTPLAVGDGIVTAFSPWLRGNTSNRMAGLVFSTSGLSGAGNQLYHRWGINGSLGMRSLISWGGDTNVGTDTINGYQASPIYQRIVRLSSTTWRGDVSPDGVSWILGTTASTWAFEPTHIGFAESNWNTVTPSVISYEFIRRVSGVA